MIVPTRDFDIEEMFVDDYQTPPRNRRRKQNSKTKKTARRRRSPKMKSQVNVNDTKKILQTQNKKSFCKSSSLKSSLGKINKSTNSREERESVDEYFHLFTEKAELKPRVRETPKSTNSNSTFSLDCLNEHLSNFEKKMLDYQRYLIEECMRIDEMRVKYTSRFNSSLVPISNEYSNVNSVSAASYPEYVIKALESVYAYIGLNCIMNGKDMMSRDLTSGIMNQFNY